MMNNRKTAIAVFAACGLAAAVLAVVAFSSSAGRDGASSAPPILPEGESSSVSSQAEGLSSHTGTLELAPEQGQEGEENLPMSNEHINQEELQELYILPAGGMVAYRVTGQGDQDELAAAINQLSLAWDPEPAKETAPADTIQVLDTDGSLYTFQVSDSQVVANGELLESTADQRASIRQLAEQFAQEYPSQPQWLAFLPLERLSQVEYQGHSSDGQWEVSVDTDDFEGMWEAAQPLTALVCEPKSWPLKEEYAREGDCRFRVQLDTGERYQVWIDRGTLVIHSSSQDQALEYTVDPEEAAALADEMVEIARSIPGSVLTLTVAE